MNREEAIKYGTEWLKDEYLDARDGEFIEIALEALKQEPRKGHWIKTPKAVMGEGYMWYCNKCEHQVYQDTSRDYPSEKYCPNCGVKMVEPQESEEV